MTVHRRRCAPVLDEKANVRDQFEKQLGVGGALVLKMKRRSELLAIECRRQKRLGAVAVVDDVRSVALQLRDGLEQLRA